MIGFASIVWSTHIPAQAVQKVLFLHQVVVTNLRLDTMFGNVSNLIIELIL